MCCVLVGELGWAMLSFGGAQPELCAAYSRSMFYCRSGSTFKVERCPFYRGDSVEFLTGFS